MRMMGAESVAYHRETIVGRADDHPGQALDYYGSRGETPLRWGGSGAAAMGLEGNVTEAQYDALYGPGGACDPTTGQRLARTKRPGMELVIAAHKSVAELGVVGRAEDMHAIMDAERDATLAYLDDLTKTMGGRRGRAATPTPTAGLLYAQARHATTRAGDPGPHDHVLLANVVEMADERGGHKAAITALWREHVHAATMVGRVASARKAVELGYAIVADDGPSGRLGHWAIAGVPEGAMELHSKRSAEIDAECASAGYATYQARQVAARETRRAKRHTPVDDLLPRWRAELADAGYPVADIVASIERASRDRGPEPPPLSPYDTRRLVDEALDANGRLAERKVFTRRDVVVAVGPALFGRDPAELPRLVEAVLADPEAVPLLRVAGASERAYATASTLAREAAIEAAMAARAERTDAPAVERSVAEAAVAEAERSLDRPLTAGQRDAALAITTSGRGAEVVVGIAGSGKTTALGVVTAAFEAAGYDVVGTSTSGQAARTLGREAAIAQSRTMASLLWRIEHGRLTLTNRSVVICDEAGMADDPSLLRLLAAIENAGAKLVLVGDHRQLGAVGPGGSLEALVGRHAVHLLDENVRQREPAERQALSELRAGDVEAAVAWYLANGRIATAPTRDGALERVVDGWATDVGDGLEAAMFAWRRANVAELNRRGRQRWAEAGRLSGPELVAPGGARYAAGDRVVTLAPGVEGAVVTSERGTVTVVDPAAGTLVVRMDDGRLQPFAPADTGAERLAHAYAVTAHRSQGATVEAAHAFEDGGGRELGYVKMSRARGTSTVYAVADSPAQAAEDLAREWSSERRQLWAIDSGTPARTAAEVEASPAAPAPMRAALRHARLLAQRDAIAAAMPPDVRPQLRDATDERDRLRRALHELDEGDAWGTWQGTPIGEAANAWKAVHYERTAAEANAAVAPLHRRPGLARKARRAAEREAPVAEAYAALTAPERRRLGQELEGVEHRVQGLEAEAAERRRWLREHPEAGRRLAALDVELDYAGSELVRTVVAAAGLEQGLEHDMGIGL